MVKSGRIYTEREHGVYFIHTFDKNNNKVSAVCLHYNASTLFALLQGQRKYKSFIYAETTLIYQAIEMH